MCDIHFPKDDAIFFVQSAIPLALFQIVTFPILVFVSFKKPPMMLKGLGVRTKWMAVMAPTYALIVIIDFVLIPLYLAVQFIFQFKSMGTSHFAGQLIVVAVTNAVFVLYWTPSVYQVMKDNRDQMNDAKVMLMVTQGKANQTWNDMKNDTDLSPQIKKQVQESARKMKKQRAIFLSNDTELTESDQLEIEQKAEKSVQYKYCPREKPYSSVARTPGSGNQRIG
jgi:hypothetical protein